MYVITVWESTGRFIIATSGAFPCAAGLPCRSEARTPAIGWRTGMADGSPEADVPRPGHRVIRPDADASGGESEMGFLPRPTGVAARGAPGTNPGLDPVTRLGMLYLTRTCRVPRADLAPPHRRHRDRRHQAERGIFSR